MRYLPDNGRAYTYTYDMIHSRVWHLIIGFHYFDAFLILWLVMIVGVIQNAIAGPG